MPWTFVRPSDPSVLSARPLVDIGTGDGQTLRAVVDDSGLVVGLERSFEVLRTARLRRAVCGEASALPISGASVGVVLAADLFHHFEDEVLAGVLAEVRAVLRDDGRLVAWWYESETRGGPGAPRFPRTYDEVAKFVVNAGFSRVEPLSLVTEEAGPPTVGLVAS